MVNDVTSSQAPSLPSPLLERTMRVRSVLLAVTAAVALSAVPFSPPPPPLPPLGHAHPPARESMSVETVGDLCTGFFVSPPFHGTVIRKASLIDEGFISVGYGDFFGGQASIFAFTQWTR